MDIYLADEQSFHYVPKFAPDVALDRVEQKKIGLIAGTVGSLLSRPKPEEFKLVGVENRLEPFWLVSVSSHTRFDRNRTYAVLVSGPEVQTVTLLGQDLTPEPQAKDAPKLSITAVEHCLDEHRATRTFDALNGEPADMSKYLAFPKTLIVELENFAPPDTVVIPPQTSATAVVRRALADCIKPVQQAHTIFEERVDVEAMELNFRPVYAMEYEWAAKGKRSVIEFDALTGDVRGGGRKLQDQVKGMVTRDLLFDVTADAVGLIVPGGSIAVKLVKAVVDRGKS